MRRAILAVVLGCALAAPLVHAQMPMSDEARKQILAYQLTLPRANQLIAAMAALSKQMVTAPDFKERMPKLMKMSNAERKAEIEKDPKSVAILKEHKLTVDEYLVGVPTLRMAMMMAQGMPASANVVASPVNVAFAKANLAELKPKMEAAENVVVKSAK
jgi:hypothetical protein